MTAAPAVTKKQPTVHMEELTMHKTLLSAAIMAMVIGAPAFAATQYYVAQKPGSHACSVTSAKPDGKSATMVGTKSYKTQAAAAAAMKSASACK